MQEAYQFRIYPICTNVSLFVVETHLYMVYPNWKLFLVPFLTKNEVWGPLLGPKIGELGAQEAYQFSIFPCQIPTYPNS